MNELQIFKSEKFGEVRVQVINEIPYFNLNDVCEILGLKNPRDVKTRLNQKGVVISDTPTKSGIQQMNYIDESNFYKCIFRSNKPEAEEITEWVTGEVLPMIRKTGMYITNNLWEEIISNPAKLGEAFIEFGKVKKENENLKFTNKIQEQQIIELQPKALYYDLILQCKDLLSTTVIAKDYGMAAKGFNKMLHEYGIQYNQGGVWFLYQKYAVYGYTQTKTNPITRSDGTVDGKPHMYWTQKGRIFLYEFLKKEGIVPLIEIDNEERA